MASAYWPFIVHDLLLFASEFVCVGLPTTRNSLWGGVGGGVLFWSRTTLGQQLNSRKSLDLLTYPQSQPPGEGEGSVRILHLSERLHGQLTPSWGLGGRERLMTKSQLHARCFHLPPRHPLFSEDKETMTQRGSDLPRYTLLTSGHAGDLNPVQMKSKVLKARQLFYKTMIEKGWVCPVVCW